MRRGARLRRGRNPPDVGDHYRAALKTGWGALLLFLGHWGLSVAQLGSSASSWDAVLLKFCQTAYRSGGKYWVTLHAVLAVQRRLHFHRVMLRKTWRYMWRWRRSKLQHHRPPLPPMVWQALVGATLARAFTCTSALLRRSLYGAALTFWLAFLGLLRPCEMCPLDRAHTLLSTDFLSAAEWVTVVIDSPSLRYSW